MPPDRILSILARERRAALIESLVISLLFFAGAIVLTLLAHFFLTVIATAVLGFVSPIKNLFVPQIWSVAIILLIAVLNRRRLLDDEFDLTHAFDLNLFGLWRGDVRDLGEGIGAFFSILIIGPRCAFLAFKAARLFFFIGRVDIKKLRDPIDFALNRRRKVSQQDLPGISIDKFLEQTAWLKGVVPLYSEPIGFVLSSAFRTELRGEPASEPEDATAYEKNQRRRRAEHREPREHREEPKPRREETLSDAAWAYSVLELPINANAEEVKSAYRRLAKIYHPDVCHTPEAASKMKEINLAKEILASG